MPYRIRDKNIHIRVTKKEKDLIFLAAKRLEMSVTNYLLDLAILDIELMKQAEGGRTKMEE